MITRAGRRRAAATARLDGRLGEPWGGLTVHRPSRWGGHGKGMSARTVTRQVALLAAAKALGELLPYRVVGEIRRRFPQLLSLMSRVLRERKTGTDEMWSGVE